MNAPKVDLRKEQRAVLRQALAAFALCAGVLAFAALALPRWLSFPAEVADRLAWTLRADVIVALWVVVAIRSVASIRFISAEDNAGSAYGTPSARLTIPAAFLQNTLEQATIAIIGHLALATVAGEAALAYVIGAVGLFCVGRVTFRLGYHKGAGGRAFGVATTAIPTVGAYAWVLFEMGADAIRLAGS